MALLPNPRVAVSARAGNDPLAVDTGASPVGTASAQKAVAS